MKVLIQAAALLLVGFLTGGNVVGAQASKPALDLTGYVSDDGAITILHNGEFADPYFAMQALLLAHENGWDVSVPASRFARWLVARQKPDGTFGRFCRSTGQAAHTWTACQPSDADDSLLALWLKLLETMPDVVAQDARLRQSEVISRAALAHLFQPSRGVYMVSPLVLHGLFMDNLEVWSFKVHRTSGERIAEANRLAQAIRETFWNPASQLFRVSTQLEQQVQKPAFYPDYVAQIFPLLVDFPQVPGGARLYYQRWMQAHRADWLSQGKTDYPWGLLAVLAVRHNDTVSARCWLREAAGLRHSARWAVTDEVAYQIVTGRKLIPAPRHINCL